MRYIVKSEGNMKKIIFGIIFYFCVLSVISGQDDPKNMVAGGINLTSGPMFLYQPLPGINLEYERILNKMFSIGVDIGSYMYSSYMLPYIEFFGSWYPWSEMFFARLGLGVWVFLASSLMTEVGWKINVGKENTWSLIPSLKVRMLLPLDEENSAQSSERSKVSLFSFLLLDLGFLVGYKF